MTDRERQRRLVARHVQKAESALRAAEVLLGDNLHDDSISRSYYAMFHTASALLLTKALSTSKHKGVLSLFDLHFVKPGIVAKEVSGWLHEAFEFRQEADYGDFALDPRAAAVITFTNAKRFLEELRPLLSAWMEAEDAMPRDKP